MKLSRHFATLAILVMSSNALAKNTRWTWNFNATGNGAHTSCIKAASKLFNESEKRINDELTRQGIAMPDNGDKLLSLEDLATMKHMLASAFNEPVNAFIKEIFDVCAADEHMKYKQLESSVGMELTDLEAAMVKVSGQMAEFFNAHRTDVVHDAAVSTWQSATTVATRAYEEYRLSSTPFSALTLECLSFLQQDETATAFIFELREVHNAACGGDPQTMPRVMALGVAKDGKSLLSDRNEALELRTIPLHPAK